MLEALTIQVSMYKMLRWEKKGPYDTMKFLFKNIENKFQDCFKVCSCNTYMLNCMYTYTCTIKTNLTLLSKASNLYSCFSIIILPICMNINLFCHCVNIFSKSSVSY